MSCWQINRLLKDNVKSLICTIADTLKTTHYERRIKCAVAKIDHVAVTQQKNVLTTLIGQKNYTVRIQIMPITKITKKNRNKRLNTTY